MKKLKKVSKRTCVRLAELIVSFYETVQGLEHLVQRRIPVLSKTIH